MLEQVHTTSSHQRAAGTRKWATYGSSGARAGSARSASGRPQPRQLVATSTGRPIAAMMPKESQAHPPHHFCSSEATTNPIHLAEKGWAIRTAVRSASRTRTCRSWSRRQPARTSSSPTPQAVAASAADGGRPCCTKVR
jgi:hypothetical protein